MATERAAHFAAKAPEGWENHVEAMRATRMFLLQTMGPTRFVVRGEDSDRKFTVLVGNMSRCSCGISLCLHHLFIMLKVLKVSPTSPLAWQVSLIDSEVDSILAGGKGGARHFQTPDMGRAGAEQVPGKQPSREFLRRGTGRTSAGGIRKGGTGEGVDGGISDKNGETGNSVIRQDIVPGEVCPVCQEDLVVTGAKSRPDRGAADDHAVAGGTSAGGGRGGGRGRGRGGGGGGALTYCIEGCGNNMHARCMLIYAEHRRSAGDKICCPLCRINWGPTAVRALKENARERQKQHWDDAESIGSTSTGSGCRRRRDDEGTAAAVVPVTCRTCKAKVQAAFFRCVVCMPAGSWDLCRRCYANTCSTTCTDSACTKNAGKNCTPLGKRRHPFVQGDAGTHTPDWKPAKPPRAIDRGIRDRRQHRDSIASAAAGRTVTADVMSLQGREITAADFGLLLTLDVSPTPPLYEFLLEALPRRDAREKTDISDRPVPSVGNHRGHGDRSTCPNPPEAAETSAPPNAATGTSPESSMRARATPVMREASAVFVGARAAAADTRAARSPATAAAAAAAEARAAAAADPGTTMLSSSMTDILRTSHQQSLPPPPWRSPFASVSRDNEGNAPLNCAPRVQPGVSEGELRSLISNLASASSASGMIPSHPQLTGGQSTVGTLMTAATATVAENPLSLHRRHLAVPAMKTSAVRVSMSSQGTAPQSFSAGQEAAAVPGSFVAAGQEVSCCCCSFGSGGYLHSGGGTESSSHRNDRTLSEGTFAPRRQPSEQRQRRQLDSRSLSLRHLPCGHCAHDACLIPMILESIGRGDPSRCLCPIDSSALFPALYRRHRRRRRRNWRSNSEGPDTEKSVTNCERIDDTRPGLTSMGSLAITDATFTIPYKQTSRREPEVAVGRAPRTRIGAGDGKGASDSDVHGITLYGSSIISASQQRPTKRHQPQQYLALTGAEHSTSARTISARLHDKRGHESHRWTTATASEHGSNERVRGYRNDGSRRQARSSAKTEGGGERFSLSAHRRSDGQDDGFDGCPYDGAGGHGDSDCGANGGGAGNNDRAHRVSTNSTGKVGESCREGDPRLRANRGCVAPKSSLTGALKVEGGDGGLAVGRSPPRSVDDGRGSGVGGEGARVDDDAKARRRREQRGRRLASGFALGSVLAATGGVMCSRGSVNDINKHHRSRGGGDSPREGHNGRNGSNAILGAVDIRNYGSDGGIIAIGDQCVTHAAASMEDSLLSFLTFSRLSAPQVAHHEHDKK